jgi:dihydrodipicolinate synthase/N-acetylneuraminate lyase
VFHDHAVQKKPIVAHPESSMPQPLFRGACASSITPFHPDGSLRIERLRSHIDWLISQRVDAISPLGSSGEFPAMECADRERMLPEAHRKTLANLLVNLGYEVHSEGIE